MRFGRLTLCVLVFAFFFRECAQAVAAVDAAPMDIAPVTAAPVSRGGKMTEELRSEISTAVRGNVMTAETAASVYGISIDRVNVIVREMQPEAAPSASAAAGRRTRRGQGDAELVALPEPARPTRGKGAKAKAVVVAAVAAVPMEDTASVAMTVAAASASPPSRKAIVMCTTPLRAPMVHTTPLCCLFGKKNNSASCDVWTLCVCILTDTFACGH